MLFDGYTLYGICLLFQGHSPGGATVLLCLICYVVCRAADWGVGDEVVMGIGWACVRGRVRGYF